MYAYERTLLAKLGFADPDRREPLHDMACPYLATADAVGRFVHHLGIEHQPKPWLDALSNLEEMSFVSRRVVTREAMCEHEISKGIGQYRTTVGFADLVLCLRVEVRHSSVKQRKHSGWNREGRAWSDWQVVNDYAYGEDFRYGIEVKITPTAIGDVIRQVKLYRSYANIRDWTLATAFDLSASNIATLQNERIRHLRLGKRFDEYVALRQTEDAAASVEI